MKLHRKLIMLLTFLLLVFSVYAQFEISTAVGRTKTNELTLEVSTAKVYPNPFTEFCIVEFENAENLPCKLELYGPTGIRVLIVENITGNSLRIERNDLKKGLYFFKLSNIHGVIGKGRFMIK